METAVKLELIFIDLLMNDNISIIVFQYTI